MPRDPSSTERVFDEVCYPGYGLLLRDADMVCASGEVEQILELERFARGREDETLTFVLEGKDVVVCLRRGRAHALLVAVPSSVDTTAVHERMRRALTRFDADVPGAVPSGPRSSGGTPPSGAPAELFVGSLRPRRG